MDIIETRHAHGVTLAIDRSLDLTSAGDLDRALALLMAKGDEAIYVDVKGVQSIDSAGLTVFLKWHRAALADKRRFGLVNANEFHRKLLEITRLDTELMLFDAPGGHRLLPSHRKAAWDAPKTLLSELERVI